MAEPQQNTPAASPSSLIIPIDSIKIGDFIKKARVRKKISLKIVSQHTKISATMLEFLENNQLEKLPNKAYVVGHIKSCAKILGLDLSRCLSILEENYKGVEPPKTFHQTVPSKVIKEYKKGTKIPVTTIIIIALLVIPLLYVVYRQTKTMEDGPPEGGALQGEAPDPIESQVLSSRTPLMENRPSESGESPPLEEAPPSGGEFEGAEAAPEQEVVLRPIRMPLYSVVPEGQEREGAISLIPEEVRNSLQEGTQNVFVLADSGETWLTYQRDDGPIHQFFLREGQHLFVQGDIILMFVGRVSAVKVFLNNNPLIVNSSTQVKTLVFPHEKRGEYFFPLFVYRENETAINSKDYKASLENL